MSGTPLDLTPFGAVLSAIGWLFWLLVLGLLVVAWWLPRVLWQKIAAVAIVAAGLHVVIIRPLQVELAQRQAGKGRLDEAMALFKKRCESAGEKIARTTDGVEGVVWMKWREPISNADNFADQFKLNDPYGNDCGAEDCIARLLRVTSGASLNPEEAKRHVLGYRFVDTIDPADGQRYRYRAVIKSTHKRTPEQIAEYRKNTGRDPGPDVYGFALERELIQKFDAIYGITWDDVSTREDREHWVAASALKIVDLRTNEVVAERIGYMIDQGQGSQAGFRSPWLFAQQTACPEFPQVGPSDPRRRRAYSETRDFVLKIIRSTQGE